MRYLMTALEARSGLTARTTRHHICRGFLDPPKGHGLAATYDEEQFLRAVTIAWMRAAGADWDAVGRPPDERVAGGRCAIQRSFANHTFA